jgi:hypothetical protein
MKRISFLLITLALLVLSVGPAFAVGGAITVDHVDGLFRGDTIGTGSQIEFWLRYDNMDAVKFAISNGYEIYAKSGVKIWSGPMVGDTSKHLLVKANFDLAWACNKFIGATKDTVAFIGAFNAGPALPPGFNDVPYGIQIGSVADQYAGDTLCIDSAFFRPGGTWKWAGSLGYNVFPSWGGPYCYVMYKIPDLPPVFTPTPPATLTSSHCVKMTYTFHAVDPEQDVPTYAIVSGPGSINATTGAWEYMPTLADVGQSITLVVSACDPPGKGGCSEATVNIVVTDAAPVLTCPTAQKLVSLGDCKDQTITATDECQDPIHFVLDANTPIVPADAGITATIDPNTGVLHFCASLTATTQDYEVIVYASDTKDSSVCRVPYKVIAGCPYQLKIAKVEDVLQGHYWTVPITLVKGDAAQGLGGFDLVIAYDQSALSFQNAALGQALKDCGWEYFTYRFGANGNCGNACPSGMIHLVGIAETNNGPYHPSCFLPGTLPTTLVDLNFLVSNDRTFNCMYVPVRFYWTNCTDNTLSNTAGSQLYISCSVAEWENPLVNLQDIHAGFPTYLGAQAECEIGLPNKPAPIRDIDFINGGVDIICSNKIDARGDINQNSFAYEIADAVMFTNYFIQGLSAFSWPGFPPDVQARMREGAIAASDVNADGVPLSVADLVYLIRVIVGDAPAFVDKIAPVSVSYTFRDGVLSVPEEMGALFAIVKGNVTPTLIANGMLMNYGFDGANTRILVYPNFNHVTTMATFKGDVLAVNSEIVSIEMATAAGATVAPTMVPNSFSLNQNYPNPFNPSTVISFNLPVASRYTLTIYNVVGQKVYETSADAQPGEVKSSIDMSGNASGIYFYKVEAGSFSATKKMILMK